MNRQFIERRDGSLYVSGSRVALAHLVREFQRGELPEAIRSHYPSLTLEQVYGAITFTSLRRDNVLSWLQSGSGGGHRRTRTHRR